MKLILIEGGPASGKNTLGELLINKLSALKEKSILLDLDTYVEQFNPKWIWENDNQKEQDQLNARINFYRDIGKHLSDEHDVIAIGDKWTSSEAIQNVISRIGISCTIYLYHLSTPFTIRQKRLHLRGPHSLIDLEKSQREKDAINDWPGYVYENINSPEHDAEELYSLIQQEKGLISQN